ncbi:MAG: tripartite tricarboxylate transporter permease [Hyphomicrobiaceae bacterium]
MDIITNLFGAMQATLAPIMLVTLLAGVFLGMLFGALPGFGSSQSLALLFPLTFAMQTDQAILFFLAIYSAAEYGGSIPAILIRTPGTPAQSVTVLDGYEMAKKGLAKKALRISLYSGVIGGMTSTLIFIFGGTSLAYFGLMFGPGEMFALGVFGLSIIGSFFGRDAARGFLATGIGLLIATIGSSGFGGIRFSFDQSYLMEGVPLVVVIIGFLAGPEAYRLLIDHRRTIETRTAVGGSRDAEKQRNRVTLLDARRLVPTWIRCSLIGTAIGAIPGAGASIGALIAYGEEKRWSKRSKEFGTGVEEGLAAPETANNAVVAGTLVPSLALGIPGSGAAAILLGVLISKGVVPGPLLFKEAPDLIATVFTGLIMINLGLLLVGFFGTSVFAAIARVPRRLMGPFVLLLIVLGAYAFNNYLAHVLMVLAIGAIAYIFQKIEIPVVPIVLAFVMGPIIEQNLARALTIHQGELSNVMLRPITLIILALAIITAVYGMIAMLREHRDISPDEPT